MKINQYFKINQQNILESNNPHLFISQITVNNFKSYKNQHIINFNPQHFTCITGANGSGKSNILDAILFTLGFRSKYLRQNKLTDLIYNQNGYQADFADVSITFTCEQNQFVIGRQVRLSGASFYYLNNEKCNFERIEQVLLENGLDIKHNRFLILQGEVESISMMKPMGDDIMSQMVQQQLMNLQIMKNMCFMAQIDFDPFRYDELYQQFQQILEQKQNEELQEEFQKIIPLKQIEIQSDAGLLEFIENIVGTQEEIPQIAKQAALVEFVNSVMNDTRNQLQQAVQYKNNLDDVKNEAVTDIRSYAKKEQKAMESQMYQASNGRFTCQLLNKENSVIQNQLQELDNQDTSQLNNQITQLQQQIDQNIEQQTQLVQNKEQISEQRKQIQIQNVVNEEKLTDIKKQLQKLQNESKNLQQKLQKLQQQKEAVPYQQKQIEQKVQELDNLIYQTQQQLKQMTISNKQSEINQQIKDQINKQTQMLEKLSQQRIQHQSEYQITQSQQNDILITMIQQLKILYTNLYKIVQISQQQNKQQNELLKQKNEIQGKLNSMNEQQIKQQSQQIEQQINKLQEQIQEYEIKVSEINNNNQDNNKYNKLHQELMNAAQHGILQGVYGRLGNLGQINQEYNTAAIAAFGNQLDIIVCENIQSIQSCLEYLRQNKLGTAAFLDLQQVSKRYQQYTNTINIDFIRGYNGTLFLQLVKTENKFLPAFWHVMQETILTSNNDDALMINRYNNRQKLRVVTINGDLFEKSGALTGGNIQELLKYVRGFANQQEQVEQQSVAKINQQLQNLNKQLNQLQTQQLSYIQQLQQLDNLQQKYEQVVEQLEQIQQDDQIEIQSVQECINAIKQIQNNVLIKQLNIQVNQALIEELNVLEQQISQQNIDYQQSIQQIIELFKYYKQNQLATIKQYDQYISQYIKNNNVYQIFTDENSLLFNLLVIDEQNQEQFHISKLQNLQNMIEKLQQKEEQLKIQIQELQQKLDNDPEQQLKKQISNYRQQQHKQQQELTDIKIFIQRFDSQIQNIQQENQDNVQQQEYLNNEQIQLVNNKQQFEQQINQLLQNEQEQQNLIDTLQLGQQKLNIEKQSLQTQLDNINSTMTKLHNQQIQNQKQIEISIQKIMNSEKLIKEYYRDLQDFNQHLQLIEESIDAIKPLFNDHEMQSELENYDNYILANMNNKEVEFNREGDPITLFPNQYQIFKDYNSRIGKITGLQEHYQLISQHYDQQNNILNELKTNRQIKFNNALTIINQHLRQIYRTFSLGGDAVLEPVDPFDVFQGITLQVLPPKKSWRPVQNLSGGEKTLSSLSLIFSLHFYKQNFLYVVDEIDAALDWRNVQLVAGFMKQLQGCQLIIVSLRNGCFEQADEIIGVWKKNGESQVVQAIM